MDWCAPGDREDLVGRVATDFSTVFGRPATHVGVAPGRANLIGEHTDYNGGLCLPIALPHATYVAISPRSDDRVRLVSRQARRSWSGRLSEIRAGSPAGWAGYAAGVLWALPEWAPTGIDLLVDSTVPVGAGLSSSAALTGAVGAAMAAATGRELDDAVRTRLMRACIDAENTVVGVPTGGMDQAIALWARSDQALLLDFSTGSRRLIPIELAAAEMVLLITDTRAGHQLRDGGYAARRADCETAARRLGLTSLRQADLSDLGRLQGQVRRRARHVISEIERVRESVRLLRSGRLGDLGPVFAGSHASLRDDYDVSCTELDEAVDAALEHGAVASRMTGGGFGGSVVTLVGSDEAEHLAEAIDDRFVRRRLTRPQHLLVRPSDAASSYRI